ncbi:aminotransferase-like domain-containing protein [Sphingomonas sp. TDK1]|uniref:aminotransferase-like domain-containing protein n=1 Tax=Sphingomonas sp. TDK1 TaxID=453247 RepID=UPI0007D97252|nr:PLP-dependent aminotransferase family protein [Sphingomonas sp. TDK1]OAN66599.1 GntR family transcriptional regulator [Sphingomonas sp. TDK1]
MQGWKPDITGTLGPKYLAIAEAIARDVEAGTLNAGDRLPPQRMLAEALGVDLTTITRAYGEAQRLGLIEGDGRRGSFVRGKSEPAGILYKEPADAGMNAPPEAPDRLLEKAFVTSVAQLLGRSDGPAPFHYQPRGGMALAREAGAALLRGRGVPAQEDTVLVSAGGQHALHAVISTELQPGDVLAVGAFVYPGLLSVARRYGLGLRTVASDGEGMLPDALAIACAEGAVAAVYLVPTNDNPTTATMGPARRAALAEVIRDHGIKLIEDDAYGLLPERPLTPIASLVPERSWHIASVSKILSPGLRVAWVAAPDVAAAWRLAADLHETAVMAPPLNVAVVADWLHGSTFDTLCTAMRAEARARQAIARSVLRPGSFHSQEEGYHLWMPLPGGANAAEIVNALRPQGLAVVAGDAFAVEPVSAPPALRISIGGSTPRDRLERALRLLGALTTPDVTRKIALV